MEIITFNEWLVIYMALDINSFKVNLFVNVQFAIIASASGCFY